MLCSTNSQGLFKSIFFPALFWVWRGFCVYSKVYPIWLISPERSGTYFSSQSNQGGLTKATPLSPIKGGNMTCTCTCVYMYTEGGLYSFQKSRPIPWCSIWRRWFVITPLSEWYHIFCGKPAEFATRQIYTIWRRSAFCMDMMTYLSCLTNTFGHWQSYLVRVEYLMCKSYIVSKIKEKQTWSSFRDCLKNSRCTKHVQPYNYLTWTHQPGDHWNDKREHHTFYEAVHQGHFLKVKLGELVTTETLPILLYVCAPRAGVQGGGV